MHPDQSRQDAASIDKYSLTIEAALVRYEHAGHPRTARSIQRYCAQKHLDCLRQETPFGEKYLITPASVARHISQIAELAQATRRDLSRHDASFQSNIYNTDGYRQEAPSSDMSAPVAAPVIAKNIDLKVNSEAAASPDIARLVATSPDAEKLAEITSKYVGQMEGEIAFLRDEISTKNAQIKELSERSRETNVLIGGLQRLLAPLLGQPNPYPQNDNQSV